MIMGKKKKASFRLLFKKGGQKAKNKYRIGRRSETECSKEENRMALQEGLNYP